jgi:hypothetical protein
MNTLGVKLVDAAGNRLGTAGNPLIIAGPAGAALPSVMLSSSIPFIITSSGTMGNNGALSGVAAMEMAYANAYVYLPAGAIFAGSAAGWYFAQFSSTTAAQVFNNFYSTGVTGPAIGGGTPQIPASPVPFATTGPGLFTQTNATIAAVAMVMPAGLLGPNDGVMVNAYCTYPNSAGNKNIVCNLGNGFNFGGLANTTTRQFGGQAGFRNRGVRNAQAQLTIGPNFNLGTGGGTPAFGSVDTSLAQSLFVSLVMSVPATDFIILHTSTFRLMPG